MKKFNAVGWFEIYVADIARAKAFYESVFELKLEKLGPTDPSFEMWKFPGSMENKGINGTICKMAGMQPGGNSTLVYFTCEDCSIEEGRVHQFGGKVQRPKMSIGEYGFVSLVFDTEGNLFGLHSLK